MEPTLLAFYQLKSEGDVVQIVGEARGKLTLCDPTTGEQWSVRRGPFVERLRDGYVQQVAPEWRLVGDEPEEQPRSAEP